MKQILEAVAKAFGLDGTVTEWKAITNGNINKTYSVILNSDSNAKKYVFQKVNTFVFKKPKNVMSNIELITKHLRKSAEAACEPPDTVINYISTPEGKSYFEDGKSFWRVSDFVANTVVYNECSNPDILRSCGEAFGRFQKKLSNFDATSLYETIPGFHNTRSRIAILMRHTNENPCGRVEQVFPEIAKVNSFKSLAIRLNELVDSQEMPLRVTHNDTKINNVLFDAVTGRAKTVIDLDTVMPGLSVHDFGDAIRFAASTTAEDEANIRLVELDLEKFRAFSEGFIPEVTSAITPIEIKNMALGAFTMTVELAVRFLDDYILGDQYFKTDYRGHNLVRARCQLKLAEDMYEKLGEMNKIISEISKIPL